MIAAHYEGGDLEALADLPRYHAWILDRFGPHLSGRVLEVGAGTGNFAARWLDRAREAVLVEPAPNLHERLRARFQDRPNVDVRAGYIEDLAGSPPFAPASFDAVVLVNVLEHVEDDARMLSVLAPLLRPGAALLLFVPALPFLYGTLDSLVHHMRRYTRRGLSERVRAAGLSVVDLRYFDMLGVLPWLAAGRLFRQRTFSGAGARAYDKLGVPVARALERMARPPLGKNLACVAIKRS